MTVAAGSGIVVGPGVADVVYAADATAAAGAARIRTDDANAEPMGGVTAATFNGMWLTSGSNVVWTIDTTGIAIYTYTDTLNVAGSGVSAAVTGTTTATVTWSALADASGYAVFVNTTAQTKRLSAANSGGVAVAVTASTQTALVTGLTAGTAYNVSVWATKSGVSSFLFGGAAVGFTTNLNPVAAPTGLAPAPAAIGIPVMPTFQWNAPAGATPTGYLLEVSTVSDFATTIVAVALPPAETFYAWQGSALDFGTVYYWRVTATGTGNSVPISSVFTTETEAVDPVDVTTNPPANITLTVPAAETPTYIWFIIAVGFVLTVAVIILIVRTRRVV